MLFQPGHRMADGSPFTASPNMELLFTRFLLSAVRSKGCTQGPPAPGRLDWIGRPMARSWLFRRAKRIRTALGLRCFRSPIRPPDPLTSPSNQEYRFCPCLLARRFDSGFRSWDRGGRGVGSICGVDRRRNTQAADLRQNLDIWVAHLDTGWSRHRVLFRAWRSRALYGASPLPEEHRGQLQVWV